MNAAAWLTRVRTFASLVKLSHSVFALPFAVLSLLAATNGRPEIRSLLLVVAAVVAARTAAMAYNRLADRDLDAKNPRTASREIPRGAVSPRFAFVSTVVAGAAFVLICSMLSTACLWLSLPTLAWLLGYSHVKRFSFLCHVWLGAALGLAPVAAWIAVDPTFSTRLVAPIVLGVGVLAWVAGFDVMYACQDEAFDRAAGLHSIPSRFGAARALTMSRGLHVVAFVGFVGFGVAVPMGVAWFVGTAVAAGLLVWQHASIRATDLSRIDMAFFTANGMISLVLLAAGCVDLYVGPSAR